MDMNIMNAVKQNEFRICTKIYAYGVGVVVSRNK